MRVIITGGTGLIGQALCANLAHDNHEVIVLSRDPDRAGALPADVKLASWDAQSAEGWGELADGADAIVNLAGENLASGPWTDARKRRIRDSRINAGKAVMQAVTAAQRKPRVLIQSSAVGYYGPRGDETITEDASPGIDFLARLCFEWEASTAGVEEMGVRRVVVRTGLVLSADGRALPKIVLPFKLFAGGPMGNGRQYWPWIHINDEIRAIRFLLDTDSARGPYNLSGPDPLTNHEFARQVGKVMARPAFFPVPAFVLRLVLGEMSTVLLDGQRTIPQRLQDQGFEYTYSSAEAALRDLLK